MDVGSLIRQLLGARGNLRKVRFREQGRQLECYVPDDTLWIGAKDNLVIREYDLMGVQLDAIRGVIVDAGAHAGLFSLRAAVSAQQVVALEPHPEMEALLRLNVTHNASKNIQVLPKALWVDEAGVELVEGSHSAASSVFGNGDRRFRVGSLTLDSVVASVGYVDLLKLDIEGAEFPVLCECQPETLARISSIVAELHLESRSTMLPMLVKHLTAAGYVVTVRETPLHYWRESMRQTLDSWSKLEGLISLKLAVIVIYTLVGLGRIVGLPVEPDAEKLKFLYAVQPEKSQELHPDRAPRS